MTLREKATRLCALIGVCSLGIYLAACNYGELPVDGEGTGKVELRFSASISDSPSTKGTITQPTITQGTAFADGTHLFGLFVTRPDGNPLTTGSGDNDNMKSTLTVSLDMTQTWTHGSVSLAVNNGESIRIKGYYPWTAGATATAVPFDLSDTNPAQWIDLLYLSTPAPTTDTPITDLNNSIDLTFSHAFCWVTVNLTKLSDNLPVKVKAVTIGNAYAGQKTVFNRGTLNLNTGEITGTSGPLKIVQKKDNEIYLNTKDAPVNGAPAEFNFLVPPVMRADMKDSEIVIEVTTLETTGSSGSEEEKVLTFPLSLSHLNHDTKNSLYGFQKGKHNTYNIAYNNSAMNLSLSDWHSVTIEKATLGEESSLRFKQPRNFQMAEITMLGLSGSLNKFALNSGDHLYHTFLGEVAENNNGSYIDNIQSTPDLSPGNRWGDAVRQEMVYPSIQVSGYNAAGGAQIPWKDKETGSLLAKQACVEYREGGYTDWRLPRISECYMMAYDPIAGLNFELGFYDLWSATEANPEECYAATCDEATKRFYAHKYPKESSFYVRCVRDADK